MLNMSENRVFVKKSAGVNGFICVCKSSLHQDISKLLKGFSRAHFAKYKFWIFQVILILTGSPISTPTSLHGKGCPSCHRVLALCM